MFVVVIIIVITGYYYYYYYYYYHCYHLYGEIKILNNRIKINEEISDKMEQNKR